MTRAGSSSIPTDVSGKEFGLKLTTQKRYKMNEIVRAANKRIRTAISNSRNDFDSRHISLVVADWDAYVGKIKVSTRNLLPDVITRRFHLNTLRQSIIAQIALANIARAKIEQLGIVEITYTCTLYPEAPTCKEDERTVITHPRFDRAVHEFCEGKSDFALMITVLTEVLLGQDIYLLFLSQVGGTSLTLTLQIGGEGSFSSKCGVYSFKMTDSTAEFPPGADAVGPGEAIIKPWCSVLEEPFVLHKDLLAAVIECCDKQGEPFYQGYKQITHEIGSGPETHIYTSAIDISKNTGDHYKYDDVCEDFSGTIRQSDCAAGFLVIINECGE
ncbi:MAG: hypothetical protein Q9221_009132 [Calogaya cf. arnoldii]